MSQNTQVKTKKDRSALKMVIYITVILILTGISLYSAFSSDTEEVVAAITTANPWGLVVMGAMVLASYMIDGLIILIFCRLYTRQYTWIQGLATSGVGAFYSAVTPSSTGGQFVQAYILKRQGVSLSNAASIMVMWLILYQIALILFDVVAIAVEWNKIANLTMNLFGYTFTMVPLIIFGFGLNIGVTGLVFLMSYSHRFHNFITHYVIGFFGKIKLIKNVERARESIRVQVENYRIELRRLQSNIPVTVTVIILFFLMFALRFAIPFVAGWAMGGLAEDPSVSTFFDGMFFSAFHQMVTGLIPTPGSSGVSELFFSNVFSDFYNSPAMVSAAQVTWRFFTYHLVLIVTAILTLFYRGKGEVTRKYANRQTFFNIQLETYLDRKRDVETLYQTRQLSRKDIIRKMEDTDSYTFTGDAKGHYRVEKDESGKSKRNLG